MTYNIRGGLGIDGKRSVTRIADAIRESGAQIVCLQEVHKFLPTSGLVDQARRLGDHLGMTYIFQKNFSLGAGGLGNAILSTYDILAVHSHHVASLRERRGLLEVHLETPSGPLAIFCTHLGLDAEERVTQAREIAAIINAVGGPKILCGDFNEAIDGAAVSTLLSSPDLQDALPDGSPTYPSDSPAHRIDFVFCAPSVSVMSAATVETTASDHLPVMVEIDVSANQDVQ